MLVTGFFQKIGALELLMETTNGRFYTYLSTTVGIRKRILRNGMQASLGNNLIVSTQLYIADHDSSSDTIRSDKYKHFSHTIIERTIFI